MVKEDLSKIKYLNSLKVGIVPSLKTLGTVLSVIFVLCGLLILRVIVIKNLTSFALLLSRIHLKTSAVMLKIWYVF